MYHWSPSRSFLTFTTLLVAFLAPAMGQTSGSKANGKKSTPQLRFICVTSLAEDQEVVLALSDDNGALVELGTTALRTSLVTDWLPATAGDLHLALREEKTLKSICHFQYPADTRRALVVLIANAEKNGYDSTVVDPEKAEFVKGSVMVFNFSPHTGMLLLDTKEEKVEPGQQRIIKPTPAENGMYRMMASYLDADGKTVSCYDRQVSDNQNSRKFIFLLPDKTMGLRLLSLPIFGDLE